MQRWIAILLVLGSVSIGVPTAIRATESGPSAWPEGDLLVTSEMITFSRDSFSVPRKVGPTLDAVAAWLIAHDAAVVVEGHSSVGPDEAKSLQMSQRRAERVRDALVARGCQPDRIRAVGLGTSRMLALRGAPDEFRNRRVEFRLVAPTEVDTRPGSYLLLDDDGSLAELSFQRASTVAQIPLLDEPSAEEHRLPRIPLLDLDTVFTSDDLIAPVFAGVTSAAIQIPLLDSDGPRLELLE
jgi:hypothetical protein